MSVISIIKVARILRLMRALRERFKRVKSEQQLLGTFQNKANSTKSGSLGAAKVLGSCGLFPLQSDPLTPFSKAMAIFSEIRLLMNMLLTSVGSVFWCSEPQ